MENCKHSQILLLAEAPDRLRCRHCHLTISVAELGDGFCPECFASRGQKTYDFEPLPAAKGVTRYRCESCGVIITC